MEPCSLQNGSAFIFSPIGKHLETLSGSISSTPCVYLDGWMRNERGTKKPIFLTSAPLLHVCENDPRFFTRQEMHESRSLPDLPDPQQNVFFFTFQQEEELAVCCFRNRWIKYTDRAVETGKQDHYSVRIHTKQGENYHAIQALIIKQQ